MPPKLRVLATNARHEQRLKSQISNSLASIVQTGSKLTPIEAMYSITHELLSNNPYQPPADGKCPINDLPDEILGYIFSVGVKEEEDDEWEGSDSEADEEEDEWEDVDDDDEAVDGNVKDGSGSKPEIVDIDANPFDSDSDFDAALESDEEEDDEPRIPFQVLASHVCKRWREVALDSHVLWTNLTFMKRPKLEKARMYMERAQGLPLNIYIDCTFPEDVDEEDHPDHPLYRENKALHMGHCGDADCDGHDQDMDVDADDEEMRFLSQKELSQILDLIAPEVSHWRVFEFRASTYGYVHMVLARLHGLPSAPLLEVFQVFHFEDCEDYEFFSGDDKTAFLPFHGNAPLLKDAAFWGVHIDWDAAIPNFLRGLRELELSFHAKDVRPSYSTFTQIISQSPELKTLSLSLSGPVLPDGVSYDADIEEGGWGREPFSIPSLKDLVLQFHDVKYASALVSHFDMPNVTSLLLNFDEEDYSTFVRVLLMPVKNRTEGLLSHINHLKIAGLPCDVASIEQFLGQLDNLTSLNLKLVGTEEGLIFQKLIDPAAGRPTKVSNAAPSGSAPSSTSSSSASGAFGPLPTLFCPKLDTMTTNQVTGAQMKAFVTARRAAGAPLKRICMSHDDPVSKKDEQWLRKNVEELEFFEPSDSEDEELYLEEDDDDEDDEDEEDYDYDDDDGDEDEDGGGPVEVIMSPMLSPLARHLGRGRRGPREHRGTDVD